VDRDKIAVKRSERYVMTASVRLATVEDIDLLVKLRYDYLTEDRGGLTGGEKAAIEAQLREYLAKHIPGGSFIAAIAEAGGEAVGTAFLAISERPTNPAFITGRVGVLLNVLTYPRFRRLGIATKVITALIGEAERAGVSSVELSATGDGKPLYEKLGFHVSRYTAMRMSIPQG
jgi:GNAT superfamily N-acetyltransferase